MQMTRRIAVAVDEATHAAVKAQCGQDQRTMSQYLRKLVLDDLGSETVGLDQLAAMIRAEVLACADQVRKDTGHIETDDLGRYLDRGIRDLLSRWR